MGIGLASVIIALVGKLERHFISCLCDCRRRGEIVSNGNLLQILAILRLVPGLVRVVTLCM